VNPVLAGIYKRTSKQYKRENNPLAGPSPGNESTVFKMSESSFASLSNDQPKSDRTLSREEAGAHHELARRAIGKGIRHGLSGSNVPNLLPPVPMPLLPPVAMPLFPSSTSTSTANSLSELASNYQNSLKDDVVTEDSDDNPTPLSRMQCHINSSFEGMLEDSGFLSRNSSLIDLAMLAHTEEVLSGAKSNSDTEIHLGESFEFLDFPSA
jgi:hypothetical protein